MYEILQALKKYIKTYLEQAMLDCTVETLFIFGQINFKMTRIEFIFLCHIKIIICANKKTKTF